jgi:hypothetical protein
VRIAVDVPTDDVRRERVEQATFQRLDAIRGALAAPTDARDRIEHGVFQQLAAVRGQQHVEYAIRPRRRWVPIAGFAMAATAAVVLVIALRGSGTSDPQVAHRMAPAGEHLRWTSKDAEVDASPDTIVDEQIDDSGVTLTLQRGKVDCEVEPKPDRAPFRVVAGDVTVTVVGTKFAVARTDNGIRVEVTHGKVRVTSGNQETLLTAGQSWPSQITAGTAPVVSGAASPASDPPATEPEVDVAAIDLEPVKPAVKGPTARELYDTGAALERRDPAQAARMYRKAANTRDPKFAALALYSLADVEKRAAPASALRAIDEYLRRFPNGVNVEELLWLRVDIHRSTNNPAQMNAAARAYLDRFPAGTYAKLARNRTGQ